MNISIHAERLYFDQSTQKKYIVNCYKYLFDFVINETFTANFSLMKMSNVSIYIREREGSPSDEVPKEESAEEYSSSTGPPLKKMKTSPPSSSSEEEVIRGIRKDADGNISPSSPFLKSSTSSLTEIDDLSSSFDSESEINEPPSPPETPGLQRKRRREEVSEESDGTPEPPSPSETPVPQDPCKVCGGFEPSEMRFSLVVCVGCQVCVHQGTLFKRIFRHDFDMI